MGNLDFEIISIQELNLFDGLFHGLVFSLPLSAPLLICISRFLIQGFLPGMLALFGTVLGQLCFLFFVCSNFRTGVSFWYSMEPFLALLGAGLAFCFATNFWSSGGLSFSGQAAYKIVGLGNLFSEKSKFQNNVGDQNKLTFRFPLESFTIFGFNFILMFLNPAMPATSSRIIFSSPLLFGQYHFYYSLGFILMSVFALGILWPLIFSLTIQLIQKGFSIKNLATALEVSFKGRNEEIVKEEKTGSKLEGLSASKKRQPVFSSGFENFSWIPSPKASKFLSFLIIGCVMSGTLQYSWRLFTQYPLEAIMSARPTLKENRESFLNSPTTEKINLVMQSDAGIGGSRLSEGSPTTAGKNPSLLREFPAFDSNIRHREKNLPIDRFLPIEKMNARRTLSDRPPLTEEQKSDAYFKFHSFFLNFLEKHFDNKIIFSRLPEKQKRDYFQIQYLQQLKNQFSNLALTIPGSGKGLTTNLKSEPLLARPLENNTKGKRPQEFSYIRDLISGADEGTENYMHDELQIYRALFTK